MFSEKISWLFFFDSIVTCLDVLSFCSETAQYRLRKKPTLCNNATGFPEHRNSINSLLETCNHPYLGSPSYWLKFASSNQKHYPGLDSDTSSVWNFCARCADVISRGNQWCRREMSAVFTGCNSSYCEVMQKTSFKVLSTLPRECHQMTFNSILMYCTLTEERYDYAKKLTAVISDLYKVCKTKI